MFYTKMVRLHGISMFNHEKIDYLNSLFIVLD